MTDAANTRELALGILLEITQNGAYSHLALASVLEKHQYLEKKERAFLTRIVEGTLENLIRIDYIINQFSKVPAEKMKPAIRCIMQSAVYQICFMDAVPDSAACNEAVRLAKKRGFKNLSGFVNGVLRNICRKKDSIGLPDRETDPENYLSVRYSIPKWMIRMWQEEGRPNEDIEAMLQAFQAQAFLTICTNTQACTPEELKQRLLAEGVTVHSCPGLPDAFQIADFDYLGALKSFREGLFYVQDASSMLAAKAACPKEHDFVLDVCAAPGGKAIHIAQLMHGTGRVLARDLTEYKVWLLRDNISRCNVSNMEAQIWDATIVDKSLLGKADIVVADVPCSGLGVMRRKKDIRYKMTAEKLPELARLQRRILAAASQYVKAGGRLVYSTCTIHKGENEENASWFAKEFADFMLTESRQILPGETSGDGFYIAVFEKKGGRQRNGND